MAARTLNQIGILNGKATLLTSKQNIDKVTDYLELGASIATVRAQEAASAKRKKEEKTAQAARRQEQRRKKAAAKQVEMDKLVGLALQKLKLEAVTDITSMDQLRQLTGVQLNALYWCQVHKIIQGDKAAKLAAVASLLKIKK